MKKLLSILSCAALLAAAAAPRPDAKAAALLRQMAESGRNFAPASGRTAFFARAQLKYGLERDDYLHRWVDRPLFQNTAFRKADDGNFINPETWRMMHRAAEMYQMDGYAFFPQTARRMDLFRAAATPGRTVAILPELYLPRNARLEKNPELLAKICEVVDAALAGKETYRINGRILLTSYPGAADPREWATLKRLLTQKYGDKFLIAPMHQLPVRLIGMTRKTLTAAGVEELRGIIRAWLREVDGYYYNYPPLDEFRRYDAGFDREVMIPLLHGILSEPEFKGKLLIWGTKVGHENFYRKGSFTYNCGGTSMLRGSVGSAVAAKADVINMVEWDEENENTCFRPTLYNSFSTQRIIRALSGMAKGRLFPRREDDDGGIPDLILSYRKIVVAGETLELEVVNVPEAESSGKVHKIALTLKDPAGRVVRTFTGELADDRLAELRFNVQAAEVLDHHILIPELTVDGRNFASGFTPVELRANWNGDNKWVKQPLRDLAPCQAELRIADRLPDGRVKIVGKVRCDTPMHSVELLDGGDPIYQHRRDLTAQADETREVFTITFGSYGKRGVVFKGGIKVTGATSARCFIQRGEGDDVIRTAADGWTLPGRVAPPGFVNDRILAVSVARDDLRSAALEIDLEASVPGRDGAAVWRKKIALAELARKRVWADAGIFGAHLVLRRTDIGQRIPEGWNAKEAEFTVLADPALPQSVFFVEVVDRNGKTFRSRPVTVYRPTGRKASFSAFDFFAKRSVSVTCDAGLLTPLVAEISPEYGAAVANVGGHELTGMFGHSCGWLSNLRFMESLGCGNLAENYFRAKLPADVSSAPELVRDADGRWQWKFSGHQNVSFPICSIYPYSGFELRLTFIPGDDLQKPQTLVSTGGAGFNLEIRRGRLNARLFRGNMLDGRPVAATSLPLKPNEKCDAVVRFDQKTLQVIGNGRKSKAVPCSGYQLYPAELSIGHGVNGQGFVGTIGQLQLRPL